MTAVRNGTLSLQPGGGLQFPRGIVGPGWWFVDNAGLGGLIEQAGQSGGSIEIPYLYMILVLLAIIAPVTAGIATAVSAATATGGTD